jgi:hypothetical protein
MCLVGNGIRILVGLIVLNGGSRTLNHSQAVSVLLGCSREHPSRPLRSLHHRGTVSIWIMRGFDVVEEEVVVVIMRCGVLQLVRHDSVFVPASSALRTLDSQMLSYRVLHRLRFVFVSIQFS